MAHEHALISLWQDERKAGIDIQPPMDEREITALEWTGMTDILFEENIEDPVPKTRFWRLLTREDEAQPYPNMDQMLNLCFASTIRIVLQRTRGSTITLDAGDAAPQLSED